VVGGATNSERPGGWATIYLDGRVVPHPLPGYPSLAPNGELIVSGENFADCMAIASLQLTVRNLADGQTVATLEADDGFALTPIDWSPDSAEVLVASSPIVEDPTSHQPCIDFRQATNEVLDVATSTTQPVPDLNALYARWYRTTPLLTMDCGDGTATWMAYSRWTERYVTCYDLAEPPHKLLLNGQPIADGNQFQVLGIIQP
jgi:hypothetical protein